jgi:putative glutathione S-transferase
MAYEAWFKSETSDTGAFVRQGNKFVKPFGDGDGELPIEANRYKLIWTPACPWATRQMIVWELLGICDIFKVGKVDPIRPTSEVSDWAFTLNENKVDPDFKVFRLSELYLRTDPSYSGRFTVPAIVDLRSGKIVNNDYFNLTYYWETVWSRFHKAGAPDLFPENLRDEIVSLNEAIFSDINNGVYKTGFARTQDEYEKAYEAVFRRLDWLEERLTGKRFLFGEVLTDSDIRLYVSLARFDAAYNTVFKVNRNRLIEFKNLWKYARRLYQIPAFKNNTDFDAIKTHYHVCCDPGNIFGIVPKGPDVSLWDEPVD